MTARKTPLRALFLLISACFLTGCLGIPENLKPVQGFDAQTYLGTWYEIARLENSFETGLEKISAQYSLREDGGVRVLNRGYNPIKNEWKEAEGRAYFVDSRQQGRLKVSFFWPFYGAYNIIDLDLEAGYSLVCGPDYSYLWILSRTPQLPEPVLQKLIAKAKQFGFATDKLIFVKP